MTDERIPAEVFCLAELLCDEMTERGWQTEHVASLMSRNVDDFARNLLTVDLLMCVQRDNLLVGDRMFDALADVFEVDRMFFRNIDAAWRMHPDSRRAFIPPESIFGPISRRSAFNVVK